MSYISQIPIGEPLLDRVKLIKALLDHQQRAEVLFITITTLINFFLFCTESAEMFEKGASFL